MLFGVEVLACSIALIIITFITIIYMITKFMHNKYDRFPIAIMPVSLIILVIGFVLLICALTFLNEYGYLTINC